MFGFFFGVWNPPEFNSEFTPMKTKKFSVWVTNLTTQKKREAKVLRILQERRGGNHSTPEKRLRVEVESRGSITRDRFFGPWMSLGKNMRQNMVFSSERSPGTDVIEFDQQTSEPLKMALAEEFQRVATVLKKRKNPLEEENPEEQKYDPEPRCKKPRRGNPILNANVHFQDGHVVAQVHFDGIFVAVKKWLEGWFSE